MLTRFNEKLGQFDPLDLRTLAQLQSYQYKDNQDKTYVPSYRYQRQYNWDAKSSPDNGAQQLSTGAINIRTSNDNNGKISEKLTDILPEKSKEFQSPKAELALSPPPSRPKSPKTPLPKPVVSLQLPTEDSKKVFKTRQKRYSSQTDWSQGDSEDNESLARTHSGRNVGRCQRIVCSLFSIRTFLMIGSVLGFTYQAYNLSLTYFTYPTIVDVLLEQNDKVVLPSITVCSPIQIPPSELEKMLSSQPEVIRALNRISSNSKIKNDKKQAQKQEFLRKYLHAIYLGVVNFNLTYFLSISIQETDFVLHCQLSILNSSDSSIRLPCKNFSETTVTFTQNGKCFTYFSETNKQFDSITNEISFGEDGSAATADISINLRLNLALDSAYKVNLPSELYIHASTDIMAKSNGYSLETNRKYDVFYWRSVSERLSPYYCRAYSSDIAQPQSQIDCVNRCSTEYVLVYCRCVPLKPNLRVETVSQSARICPQKEHPLLRSCRRVANGEDSKACRAKCQPECFEENYDFSATAHELSPDEILSLSLEGVQNHSALIEIIVTRKLQADVIYRQKFQLEFEQYFSNFCSLLGFWLGITVLTFYDQIKKNSIRLFRLLCYVRTKIKHKRRKIKPSHGI